LPELPAIPLVQTSEGVAWSAAIWSGWPSERDPYIGSSPESFSFQQVAARLG
jgi:hypothetical protein